MQQIGLQLSYLAFNMMSEHFQSFLYSTCCAIFAFYEKNKQRIIPRKNKHLFIKKFTQCQISNQCENCCCPVSHNFYQISWHMHGALERRQLCYQDFNKNTPIWFDDHICKLFNFVLFLFIILCRQQQQRKGVHSSSDIKAVLGFFNLG